MGVPRCVVSIPFLGNVLVDLVISNLFRELAEMQRKNGNTPDIVVKDTAALSLEGNLLLQF
jgi:hypothetical protein